MVIGPNDIIIILWTPDSTDSVAISKQNIISTENNDTPVTSDVLREKEFLATLPKNSLIDFAKHFATNLNQTWDLCYLRDFWKSLKRLFFLTWIYFKNKNFKVKYEKSTTENNQYIFIQLCRIFSQQPFNKIDII